MKVNLKGHQLESLGEIQKS